MGKVNVHFTGVLGTDTLAGTILTALRESGLETSVIEPAIGDTARASTSIVFFTTLDTVVTDLVRDLSRNGLDRVLAVACTRAAMDQGGSWRLLRSGASDVLVWDSLDTTARHVAARIERWGAVDSVAASSLVRKNLIGSSRPWVIALRELIGIGKFSDAPALILGESGTGKELAARLIHTLDPRPDKGELVVLDCTTIVPQLSGSEFFGHERGAFTGAAGTRDGVFATADGGTLFLDEVGELPLELQAQLLRVVQERTYKRVGGNTWQDTRFRLVCATNRELLKEVERGTFRRDLYYRIASTTVRLPSLKDRPEDILPLVRHFMETLRPGVDAPPLDDELREHLLRRSYPGNVRDLRQLVTQLFHRHVMSGPITVGSLPDDERPVDGPSDSWRDERLETAVRQALALGAGLKDIGRTAEDLAVRIAVEDEDGNLQRAATRLGVTDRALQMRRASRRQPD